MFFDGEYRLIGTVSPDELQQFAAALPESAWSEETGRQEVYPAHRHTQTIPLIFDPDMRHAEPSIRPRFADVQPVIQPIMDLVVADFAARSGGQGGDGYFVRVLLARLNAGERIGSHRDHGYSLARAHRIHCPIFTNPQAEFGIAGNIKHLAPGEVWEINNRKVHGVRNLGDESRVHLILDYVVPGEIVMDPEGELVA
jgi:hypothetical protein